MIDLVNIKMEVFTRTSISLILAIASMLLVGCATTAEYAGPSEGTPTASIWFTRNTDGVQNKKDYMQGYKIVPGGHNDRCNGGARLAWFSSRKDYQKTVIVEAEKPLTIFAHSADFVTGTSVVNPSRYNVCYSQFTFTPRTGETYQVSLLGNPNKKKICKPLVRDISTSSPPEDLAVHSILMCQHW